MRMHPLGRMAAGLISAAALALGLATQANADDPANSNLPPTETVQILDGAKSGDLAVHARGAGESKVRISIENKSSKRLNVVIPPGLVAANTMGQGIGGQSMGLSPPTANPGGFGAFRSNNNGPIGGFRSIPATAPEPEGIAVSPGQTVEMYVPSVCLNYGLTTPTPKHVFKLMTVETYSPDLRVRRALKSLATLGTSQTIAQAVMWNVCNGLTIEQLASQTVVPFNAYELSQASRFLEAVDASSTDIVEPAYFQQGRIALRIHGEGLAAKDAKRLATELEGGRFMGLPVRIVTDADNLEPRLGTLLVNASLTQGKAGQSQTHVTVRSASVDGHWVNLGQFDIKNAAGLSDLKPEAFTTDLGRGMAKAFVNVSVARRSTGSTTLKITNRLPMTISNLTLRAGKAGDLVRVDGLGVGTGHSANTSIPAATAAIDSVELNGL